MEAQTGETKTVIIPEEISKRITSLRFLLIVLVVFIHANLKVDVALKPAIVSLPSPVLIKTLLE